MESRSRQNILIRFLAMVLLQLMCFGPHQGFSQDKPPIEWSRFNLLAIDSVWKYQDGIARPEYFDPQYDDQHWQAVDKEYFDLAMYAKDFMSMSDDSTGWSGIGVFRKKFTVPDSLQGRRAELMLWHFGASAIYLDGKLLCQFGNVSESATEEKQFIPHDPIQVELDNQSSHILAIYYSNHLKQSIQSHVGLSGFKIMLSPLQSTYEYTKSRFPHWMISMCIIISFCLFFCFVYGFYPHRLASLISALYLANFSLIFVGGTTRNLTNDVERWVFGDHIWEFAFTCHYGWCLLFLYSIYYNTMSKRSWIPAGLMTLGVILMIFFPGVWGQIIRPFVLLLQLEAWRIIILGLRKKKTGFWILATGWFLSFLGLLFPIFDVFNVFPPYLTVSQTVLAVVSDMLIPLTLALQLAWEFGSANRDLRRQLVSVSDLSRKNLEQEQEKQQLLSTQNETLEKQVSERTAEVVSQNKEIKKQRDQVTNTLEELRSAQKQLIQSEKMASLGELTAGIAHEIQNPLNFVKNFSEVNAELIEEANLEIEKGNIPDVKTILKDIKGNGEKINEHGKRADAIVKGMLQHSRSSSGVKEPTNINALADEYLRLAYHGLRAKDKSFNVTLQTNFDEGVGNVNVIPQDIGRVILNLLNNAFYAVSAKTSDYAKASSDKSAAADGRLPAARLPDGQGQAGYEPMVSISTGKSGDKVLISVKDNGNGIPKKVLDKIFQPFFTTKPTGQGTGLGLSLSYDIVKAHGGQLKVETTDGQGARFIIELPV